MGSDSGDNDSGENDSGDNDSGDNDNDDNDNGDNDNGGNDNDGNDGDGSEGDDSDEGNTPVDGSALSDLLAALQAVQNTPHYDEDLKSRTLYQVDKELDYMQVKIKEFYDVMVDNSMITN